MADLFSPAAGARLLDRHGGAARDRARPSHRGGGDQADVALDAGFQRLADPRAADRQLHHRGFRLARRLLGSDDRGRARLPADDFRAGGDAAGRAPRRQLVRRGLEGLQVLAARPDLRRPFADRRLRHSKLLRLSGELVIRHHRLLRLLAVGLQPVLRGQRGVVLRRVADERLAHREIRAAPGRPSGRVRLRGGDPGGLGDDGRGRRVR